MRRNPLLLAVLTALVGVLASTTAFASGMNAPVPVQIEVGGMMLEFNHPTIVMAAVGAVFIILFCWVLGKSLSKEKPSKGQALLEMIVKAFDDLTNQALGPNRGRKFLPYIGTLFLFIWTCNMLGLLEFIPVHSVQPGAEIYQDYNNNHAYDPGETYTDANDDGKHNPGVPVPGFEEPTKNLNVPLAMALLFVFLIGHGAHIRYHGVKGYLADYLSPGGFIGVVMLPLNIVGKLAEIVSISFRLFGNIFGGVVIISVVSGLLHYLIVPIGLFGFFGVFVGTIQAFVFTMLAMTYIAAGAAEEE